MSNSYPLNPMLIELTQKLMSRGFNSEHALMLTEIVTLYNEACDKSTTLSSLKKTISELTSVLTLASLCVMDDDTYQYWVSCEEGLKADAFAFEVLDSQRTFIQNVIANYKNINKGE